jgi:hypothetical protein
MSFGFKGLKICLVQPRKPMYLLKRPLSHEPVKQFPEKHSPSVQHCLVGKYEGTNPNRKLSCK